MTTAARKHLVRCWASGAFAFTLAMLPAITISAPAIGRADPICPPGFVWSGFLNQCVVWVPSANGPAAPVGPRGPGSPGLPTDPCPRSGATTQSRGHRVELPQNFGELGTPRGRYGC